MLGQTLYEQPAIKSLVDDRIEQHHDFAHIISNREVDDAEVVLRIQHVEILDHFVVCNVSLTEGCGLVEDGEGVAHTTICLFGDDGQCLLLILDALFLSDGLQMVDRVTDGHPFEVVNLTTAEDGGQDLMLLGGGEDEDDMCGRLLERLQKGVEGCCGEHVHLVDDKHLVSTELRWDACLLHQRLDVFYTIVRGCIELEDVQGTLLVERLAALTLVAGLACCRGILAVDGLGEDTGTGGLSYTTRSAEEVGMRQFSALHGILQSGGECRLTNNGVEGRWTVLTC